MDKKSIGYTDLQPDCLDKTSQKHAACNANYINNSRSLDDFLQKITPKDAIKADALSVFRQNLYKKLNK